MDARRVRGWNRPLFRSACGTGALDRAVDLTMLLVASWFSVRVFPLWCASIAALAVALGFIIACERAHFLDHPVLSRTTPIIAIEGRILSVEPSVDGVRVTMDRLRLPRLFDWNGKEEPIPERIRVRFGQMEENLRIGGRIVFRGGLSPPSPPAIAGAYDFARTAWFMELGARSAMPSMRLKSCPRTKVSRVFGIPAFSL